MRAALDRGEPFERVVLNDRKDGSPLWYRLRVQPMFVDGTLQYFVGVQEDYSQAHAAQRELERLAYHDSLTGLGNRRAFDAELNRLVSEDQSFVLLEHGQVLLPGGPLGLRLDGPTDSPSTSQVFPQLPASWPVGLQPNLTRLLSDLQAGYALVEVRGEVVLLTPSGQQVRLVDPRAVAALVKQGWLARDGHSFCLTVPPLSRTQ